LHQSTLAEVVPEKILGLPAHPLLVHMPVVLVPLAAILALLALVVARWRPWALPVTAILTLVGLVGVQLAMWSGDNLREGGENRPLVSEHSELAQQARPIVFAFFAIAAVAAVTQWQARRSDGPPLARRLLVPLCALSVLAGGFATTWIGRTGHTGAKSVWEDKGSDEGEAGG
jgi:uncharacterized membrane protein